MNTSGSSQKKAKTVNNIGVYYTNHFYIVPLKRARGEVKIPGGIRVAGGLWTESEPIFEAEKNNLNDLANKLQEAKNLSSATVGKAQVNKWGSKEVFWTEDSKHWSVKWFDNGDIQLSTWVKHPKSTSRSFGWTVSNEIALPQDITFHQIASEMVTLAG